MAQFDYDVSKTNWSALNTYGHHNGPANIFMFHSSFTLFFSLFIIIFFWCYITTTR